MEKQSSDIPALDVVEPAVIKSSTKSHEKTESQRSLDWQRNPKNPVNWSPIRQWSIITLLWGTNTVAYVLRVILSLYMTRLAPTACCKPCNFRRTRYIFLILDTARFVPRPSNPLYLSS